ncbi:MaoC family dehydratase [Demequina sp.]|uniref:MaoC family dehydratase n=1 Tax=Demequina sp. TaxID=2050685 RepID=UPI003A842B3D
MAALADRRIEHLDTMPAMGGALARSLMPSRSTHVTIPEHAVRVHDHTQDPERLARYARVCGFTLRDTVPATWLHVLTFPLHVHLLGDPDSSVRLLGAVHTANAMTLVRPVAVSEKLDLSVYLDHARSHRKGALIDLIGTVHVGDDVVWQGTSTYLAAGMSVNDGGPGEEGPRAPFEAGPVQARWLLPKDLGRQYRAVSKDPNPIHTHALAAKAFGFPRPIAHGMWTHARALAALDGRLPDTFAAQVDFVKPVLLPGTVGFSWTQGDHTISADVVTKDGAKPHLRMRVTPA